MVEVVELLETAIVLTGSNGRLIDRSASFRDRGP